MNRFVQSSYGLVAVGVNQSPRSELLKYAERDTVGIACALAGQLGPIPRENAEVLLGPEANRQSLDLALAQEVTRRPRYFAFYFGGHGNRSGIALSDGIYPFSRLRYWLKRIGARGAIVMLNSCEAGGFVKSSAVAGLGDADLPYAWEALLLAAVPGTRIFMACSADSSTFEVEGIGGIFPHALINAMQAPLPGDLPFMGRGFVSDELVFERTESIMRGYGIEPIRAGTFGRLPMAVANQYPAGAAEVASFEPTDGAGVSVAVDVCDRLLLPTKIVVTASDPLGNQWPSDTMIALPTDRRQSIPARFSIDVMRSQHARYQLRRYGRCRIAWDVRVLDANGRQLARDLCITDYAA